jgi:predicted DCC family thiol-disulfide oxidoreductase YuxK
MPATLIYDGLCPFCTRSAKRLQRWAGSERLEILPLESPGAMQRHPDLSFEKAMAAVQLVLENGYLCGGAEAAFNAAALRPGFAALKFLYYLPLLRQAADLAYSITARNRRRCESCA